MTQRSQRTPVDLDGVGLQRHASILRELDEAAANGLEPVSAADLELLFGLVGTGRASARRARSASSARSSGTDTSREPSGWTSSASCPKRRAAQRFCA